MREKYKCRKLMLDHKAKSPSKNLPAFLFRSNNKKVYYGFPLIKNIKIEGFTYGAITDFLDKGSDGGCTSGDGYVEAPDGSRAGLAWEKGNKFSYSKIRDFEEDRWGVYYFAIPFTIKNTKDMKKAFSLMVKVLKKFYKMKKKTEGMENKNNMKLKNQTKKMKDIGILLFMDSQNNPLKEAIDTRALDMSVNSLKNIDKYLESIKKNKEKLTNEEINKVILRCGAYLGEVIRNVNKKRFIWVSYEKAVKLDAAAMSNYKKSLLTGFVLYDLDTKGFWFPLNKIYKFLEYGKSESLHSFADVSLDKHLILSRKDEKYKNKK